MRIVVAILVFSAIILFHEFGHFLFARLNHIVVQEFTLGLGPTIFSWGKGETKYCLKALPFGGSCVMLGEDTDEVVPGSFHAASVFGRICVVAAGPIFNFILAFILGIFLVVSTGFDPAEVSGVEEGTNAYEAGLQDGDVITKLNGYHIDCFRDAYMFMYFHPLEPEVPVELTVKRNGEKMNISFLPEVASRYLLGFNRTSASSMTVTSVIPGYPMEDAGLQAGDKVTKINGIPMADGDAYADYIEEHPLGNEPIDVTFERDGLEYDVTIVPKESKTAYLGFAYGIGYVKQGFIGTLKSAVLEVKYMFRATLMSLKELVSGHLGLDDLSGPVGVVDAIGSTIEETKSEGFFMVILNLFSLAALLSVNLGVMNLLPIPALDGGRLVFLFLEALRGKPINRQVEGSIHFAGMVLLLGLMVFVMFHDITKLL